MSFTLKNVKIKSAKANLETIIDRADSSINYSPKDFSFKDNEESALYEMVHNFYNIDGLNNNDPGFIYCANSKVLNINDVDDTGCFIIRALDGNLMDKPNIYNDKTGFDSLI